MPLPRRALAAAAGAGTLLLASACAHSASSSSSKPTPTPSVSSTPPPASSSAPAPVDTDAVSSAVPLPGDGAAGFGAETAIAVAGPGAPIVAYVWADPSGDEDVTQDEDQLLTTAYDPATKAWGKPVKIATGSFDGRFGTDMSMAADPTTGTVAVAYSLSKAAGSTGIGLALSTDGGATWKQSTVSSTATASKPKVAIGGGKIYVGFPVESDGKVHLATAAVARPDSFDDVVLPGLNGVDPALEQPAIAIAPDGTALVAYHLTTDGDYNRTFVAWTPGDSAPDEILDSAKYQNDSSVAGLTFQGDTAVAVSSVVRSGSDTNVAYLSTSTDDGKTWSESTGITAPGSGPNGLSLAAGKAETVLTYSPNGGGGDSACTGVEIAGSTDLESWRSCDPFAGAFPAVSEQKYPSAVADASTGIVYVVFANAAPTDGSVPTGILVWNDGAAAAAGTGG